MTTTHKMRCPVCGRNDGDFTFTFETVTCMDCGTSDAPRMFAVPALAPPEFDAAAIFPPDDIVAAVEKITNYFEIERQAKQWAFGKIQSRDEPALIGIEHIRNMASAFSMQLIVRPDADVLVEELRKLLLLAEAESKENNESIEMQAGALAFRISHYLFRHTSDV